MKGEDDDERLKSGEPDACVCRPKCIGSAQRYARIPKDFGSFPLPPQAKPCCPTSQSLDENRLPKTSSRLNQKRKVHAIPEKLPFHSHCQVDFDANKFRLIAQLHLTTMRPR
jgi:hypothetical protein